ncbi:UNVERIFIED_CONTAM: hypothetical protein FKN15_034030 [Acipenser sinensis]
MKNKEHTRQVRDTVVEKFKAGFGYKKISQALNIPRSTGNKETKDNPEGAAKLHSGDWSICP